jgi:alkaline phosphatase
VYVNNAREVRSILDDSRKVLAVFQGHHHAGSCRRLRRIHYYTLKALVEGAAPQDNSYAIVHVHPDGAITVNGYRRAESRRLAPRSART